MTGTYIPLLSVILSRFSKTKMCWLFYRQQTSKFLLINTAYQVDWIVVVIQMYLDVRSLHLQVQNEP